MIDYAQRLEALRARMNERNVGLIYLTPGANLFYLTGIPHRDHFRTDHNAYGDWVVGAYIGLEEGITLVAPRMGREFFCEEAETKPWFETVRVIDESEDPLEVMRQVLDGFHLGDRRLAIEDHAWAQTALAFRRILPEVELHLASELIAPMRMIKDEAELDRMRRSGWICEGAFQAALDLLKPGVTVWEVECEIDYRLRLLGGDFNSFPTNVMVANPQRDSASTIGKTRWRLEPGDAVMFDFGCIHQGYASDFGRTAFIGDPPPELLRMHDLVLSAQAEAMEAMVAGQITGAQANAIARGVIEGGGFGPEFGHRLGHGIGVTVHEPPWLDVVEHTVLQSGMTFTVEPSLLVLGGHHTRVEDVVLVTENGGRSLYNADRELYIID